MDEELVYAAEVEQRERTLREIALAFAQVKIDSGDSSESSVSESSSSSSVSLDDEVSLQPSLDFLRDLPDTEKHTAYTSGMAFPRRSLYDSSSVEYGLLIGELAKGGVATFSLTEDGGYTSATVVLAEEAEMLTTQEAQQLHQDMQYATLVGAPSDIDFRDRRKIALWALFERTLFNFFDGQALTRDTNYQYA